ncbi:MULTISPECIES: sulfite exporter TauE/SafE family protein [unclassified Pseudomonas]|uniref:sulfite exporter TauE/SafE family protein n=1 Tax=unclassified Pseudomonas TaxID=196821 RepID=UPI000D349E6B|nr:MULTISPECIES: sulfite exporter TauE/SafE family protein [unclassified Pseudomonas]RAU48516.1 sulfite exporter TauE/SafE family protein [Pseudomonas sp. RIT 409]RAU54223.1 sulfite exporter TauE/SafE family protein [Pseudomonas sp. RIT 412]
MFDHAMLSVLLGGGIGAILALTGAGGGILAVPVLVFGLGLSLPQAAPVGLLAVGLSAGVGAVLGLRQGIVRYRAAGLVSMIGIVVAPLGLYIAHRVPNLPLALMFSMVLIYACLRMLHNANRDLRHGAPPPRLDSMPCVLNPVCGRLRWTLPCARALALTGMLSGVLSGLLGVGGGFVVVPALARCTNLEMKSITATSLAAIAIVSMGSVTTAAVTGSLYWPAALPFAVGAVLGLLAGRLFAGQLAGPRLQQAFSVTGIAAAIMLAGHALLP